MNNNIIILDLESNGLLYEEKDKPVADKIYCLSYHRVTNGVIEVGTLTTNDEMIEFFWIYGVTHTFIGHNIIRFDFPLLEKLLHINTTNFKKIDTLALSWYLYPQRHEHGLESWGIDLVIAKPAVGDWQNDTLEVYINRCQEDVKINVALFNLMLTYLNLLYVDKNNEAHDLERFVQYISFKMDCAREQEREGWRLDRDKCIEALGKLKIELENKRKVLTMAMPKVKLTTIKSLPKVMYKKDGSLSENGKKWFTLLQEQGLPETHIGAVEIVTGEEDGNPGSHIQVKDWLFANGWQPQNIKLDRNKRTGDVKKIPQLANQDGTDVCDSVKILYDKIPDLEALEGLFVLRHRIGILEGFLENVNSQDYLKAQIRGLTNTLRFQHTTIVNLPQIPKPYWEEVRGCLITDEGYVLCGSDMSSLESATRNHYMYFFDPKYVEELDTPGFDSHTDIAVSAGLMTKEEEKFYRWFGEHQ